MYRPALLAYLDLRVYDLLLRAGTPSAPAGRVVIVDVDERSLAEIGRWPWRRGQVALLLDKLRRLGAATIALDMMFPEPDPDPAGDAALAETLRAGRVVLGFEFTFDQRAAGGRECVPRASLGLAVHERGRAVHPVAGPSRASGAVCSLASLAGAAGISGFLNAAPDSDACPS
jgi:CHASE2 domain-containing sensor protein